MGACLVKPLKLNGGFPGDTLHQIKNGALPRELRKKDGGLPREARKKMETCLPIKVGEPFAPTGLCTDALAVLLGEKKRIYSFFKSQPTAYVTLLNPSESASQV